MLLAMHKILVERGLCLREHTDTDTMLIFPGYYRRECPKLVGHLSALVSYRFNSFLDEIYATLVKAGRVAPTSSAFQLRVPLGLNFLV